MDYLAQFSKRMEFVAAVDSIVARRNKSQDIERQFQSEELDNLIMSVLVFIMETTLTEEQDCTIDAITDFLSEVLPAYNKSMSAADLEELSRYIVKDILQNKGEPLTYPVMDYPGGIANFPVRLIADKLDKDHKVLYELTKQGFDFLFRTKEVDDELGFEIEAIRLKMLISKKNYKKAMSQSRYIRSMLREKSNELRQFEQQLRNDIFSVTGGQYEAIVSNLFSMLNEQYAIMQEIDNMLELARNRLDEESRLYHANDAKLLTAREEIAIISENVQHALGMQRTLLTKCGGLKKLFLTLLNESMALGRIKRFDMEEEILGRMEGLAFAGMRDLLRFRSGLLTPLLLPEMKKGLNLYLAYDRQIKLREQDEAGDFEEYEATEDDGKSARIEFRNDAHVRIITLLLEFAGANNKFLFSEFWRHIEKTRHISEITSERMLFLAMLKLYDIREIDIPGWRGLGIRPQECMGEFDLDYCLTRILEIDGGRTHAPLMGFERMAIEKSGRQATCVTHTGERITIDDLEFTVVGGPYERNGENTEQAAG